ncbi:MAG TPA: LacI family DNA-binding transcriptional regulator [Lichenihabitans sp.]|nr:LacI family DNA-binding transcriptional regulator [Lichenihabitans sp.]
MNDRSAKPDRKGLGATMTDVAALAGVTKMTVSRVLRQPERVHPDTRARVALAIERLGYIPNQVAGSLTRGRSGLVAAIVPTLRHSLFADTLEGVGDVLAESGIGLIVAASSYRADVEEMQIRAMLERRPDALVLTGLTHTAEIRTLLETVGIPVVETWESSDAPIDMAVGFSNREAARRMTLALVEAGYRRIVFVNGPSETNERARHRAAGYGQAMVESGLDALPVHIVRDEEAIRPETGATALLSLIKRDQAIDAVFFTSDIYAVGALLACRAHGLDVPERLGIAGFHDLDVGRIVTPQLTTVHVPALEIGQKAGEMIVARLNGRLVADRRHEFPFRIVMRSSTRR